MRWEETPAGLVIEVDTEDETDRLGRALARAAPPGAVLGLVGPLGAGKTRLARAVAVALGVEAGAVSSPTYVLIHEYEGRLPVFHFDAYRVGGPEPFEALGVSEYWDAGGVCLVEWADLVAPSLPPRTWWLTLEPTGETSRRVVFAGPGLAALAGLLGTEPGPS
jgi:tRNA threonylcarbamoyladenosine biosynthesis protein TsaE